MEQDKCISLDDSYIETKCDGKEVTHIIDDILNGKLKMEISTRSLAKTPVNLTKKHLKKYLK